MRGKRAMLQDMIDKRFGYPIRRRLDSLDKFVQAKHWNFRESNNMTRQKKTPRWGHAKGLRLANARAKGVLRRTPINDVRRVFPRFIQ
jgi:hypothetical protein